MEHIEILTERKEDLIKETLKVMGSAIAGNTGMFIANLAFYYEIDEDTNELTVDYYPFTGNQSHSEEVFYTIDNTSMPDCYALDIEEIEEAEDVDFSDLGYGDYIECSIDEEINNHEMMNQNNIN